jgi:uncharacterized protein YukE
MADVGVRSIPELRQFGTNLNQASVSLANLFQILNGQMNEACQGWNDQKAQSFMSDFDRSKAQIDRISQEMQQFSLFIRRYCEKLEEAQSIR